MVKRRLPDLLLAIALFLGTVLTLAATEREIGFTRDEGYYFVAGERYARFFDAPPSPASIDAAFSYNPEHPALMKTLFGLSHRALAGLLPHATAFRLPAWLFAGLLSALLFLYGRRVVGRAAALVSVFGFWLVPRHFFHGHLACFDLPITTLWLAALLAFGHALRTGTLRAATLAAVTLGLALSVKLNAFFLPFAFVAIFALGPARRALAAGALLPALRRVIPLAIAYAALTPLVVLLLWPWLWPAPTARYLDYLRFHLQHVHYPWQYLGADLRAPPFPLLYVPVVTALTVPLAWLVALVTGLVSALVSSVRRQDEPVQDDRLLVLVGGLLPLLVIANPWAPHFGGVKHWMPGMPLLCLLGGAAVVQAGRAIAGTRPGLQRFTVPALAALVLLPSLLATREAHPFGTTAYNELAGAEPGAAALGMQRQYWSNTVTGVLPFLDATMPHGARVWLHEVNDESFRAYQRDGRLRADLRPAHGAAEADAAAIQYMYEFRWQELEVRRAFGVDRAALVLDANEVPLVTVYLRPGLDAPAPAR